MALLCADEGVIFRYHKTSVFIVHDCRTRLGLQTGAVETSNLCYLESSGHHNGTSQGKHCCALVAIEKWIRDVPWGIIMHYSRCNRCLCFKKPHAQAKNKYSKALKTNLNISHMLENPLFESNIKTPWPANRTCYSRSTYTKIGTIQRRLAWPLRKDDTQIREAFQIFFFWCHEFHSSRSNEPLLNHFHSEQWGTWTRGPQF